MKEVYIKPAIISSDVVVETQILGLSVTSFEDPNLVKIQSQGGNEDEGGNDNPFVIEDWDND